LCSHHGCPASSGTDTGLCRRRRPAPIDLNHRRASPRVLRRTGRRTFSLTRWRQKQGRSRR
jgi:hypothetical protein